MKEIDKIVELFQSGNYILAFELAKGIGLDEIKFLIYIWNEYKLFEDDWNGEGWFNESNLTTINVCKFGNLRLYLDHYEDGKLEYCIMNESDGTFYYAGLEKALEVISTMLQDE